MKRIDDSDLQRMITLSREGNKKSYEEFLSYLGKYLEQIIISKLIQKESVFDVVQEVLMAVHKSLPSYEIGRPFYPWLYSVMKYKLADHWRKLEKHQAGEFIEEGHSPLGESYDPAILKEVLAAIDTLSAREQRIFKRTKVLGHSLSDVALEEGVSVANVKVIVHRALKTVKEMFDERK